MKHLLILIGAITIAVCGCGSLSNNVITPDEGKNLQGVFQSEIQREWATGNPIPTFVVKPTEIESCEPEARALSALSPLIRVPEMIFQVDVNGMNPPSALRSSRRGEIFPAVDRGYLVGVEGAKYPYKCGDLVSFTFQSGNLPISTNYRTYGCYISMRNPSDYHVFPAAVADARTSSINDKYIVFSEYTKGIWIYRLDGVLVANVKTHSSPSSWCPVISSDDDIVAFSSCRMSGMTDIFEEREIYVYDISKASLTKITNDPTAGMSSPSISASGSRITFLRFPKIDNQYNTTQVCLINSDGTGYQVVDGSGYNNFPQINAGGNVIVWSHNNDVMTQHGYSIRMWQNGETTILTGSTQQNIYPDIDMTGRWLFYSREEGNWSDFHLRMIDTYTGSDIQVYDSSYYDVNPSI